MKVGRWFACLGMMFVFWVLPAGAAAKARPQVDVPVGSAALRSQEVRITAKEFAKEAYAALPVEETYAFHKALSGWREPLRRDPAAKPGRGEMELPAQGWTLRIRAGVGPVLQQAAEEFRDYLNRSMQVRVRIEKPPSLTDWASTQRVIVAGTRDHLPGCGAGLKAKKDYQIQVLPEAVVVCGFDERGAMYGLYNLEARMNLREGPFLPSGLNITRHSLYKARMTLSGLGWGEWPDRYLALLARYGFDSIFASVYANPNGVAATPYAGGGHKKQDPARVRDLINRAARYGIDLYCPILYRYTGEPENEAGLRKLVRDIVREFPEIRGYVLLTEGFYYKTWFGAGGSPSSPRKLVDNATFAINYDKDLRQWIRNWARGVKIVTEECHKINPAIEVLPWDYNIDFRPERIKLKEYVISQLPLNSIPLLTFENGKSFTRDGQRGYLQDYAINEAGPAEVTEAQIVAAKARGMRGVYAKADTWASWQFGTFPYLPAPYQWYARYQALEKYGIDGALESWSYGFKPNFIAEMRAWYSWSDAPALNELLRLIARREFGPGSEELVLRAWDHFSRALRLVPDTGPTMGTNNAVAAPLFFEKPKPRAMTLDHSWDDPGKWSRASGLNPYWPYVPRRLILFPDFSHRVNRAERYAQPFSLPVFTKYLTLAADEMEKGLESYRRAALRAPALKKRGVFRKVLLAEQLQRMMRSNRAVLEFEDLRFRLTKAASRSEQTRLLKAMTTILKDEICRTEDSLETARRDSRLGYEWEQDYIYTPHTIEEKLELLRLTLNKQIPAYRKRNGL